MEFDSTSYRVELIWEVFKVKKEFYNYNMNELFVIKIKKTTNLFDQSTTKLLGMNI